MKVSWEYGFVGTVIHEEIIGLGEDGYPALYYTLEADDGEIIRVPACECYEWRDPAS